MDFGVGSPYEGWDAQEPVIRYPLQLMGALAQPLLWRIDIQFIHANGLDLGDEARKRG